MTKSRIIFLLVLTIAILVLIWDKTANQGVVSGPSSTQAQTESPQPHDISNDQLNPGDTSDNITSTGIDSVSGQSTPPVLSDSGPPTRKALQRFLHVLGDSPEQPSGSADTRNLFAASEKFLAAVRTTPAVDQPQQEQWDLAHKLQLSGIVISSEFRCALIDENVVFLGENIGPFRLRKIESDRVILDIDSDSITLYLDE
jgi:hypothetical protein